MLQPPVLDASADLASQYGSYGALVGMELSHAVDGKGRMVDAKQVVREWWTPAETEAWNGLGQRVVAQYGDFEDPVLKPKKVNGTLTRDAQPR